MALALFDLDETLISEDSDHAWGEYIVDNSLVDAASHRQENRRFYEDYKRGQLDIDAYMRFSCRVLATCQNDILDYHRQRFIEEKIIPIVLPKALELIDSHKRKGDILVVVTATIEFITRPIADLLGIENLIAPIPEQIDGCYTGELSGIPSFGVGKVTRLREWIESRDLSLKDSHFYSDSRNDMPLLNLVDNPVVVDPDPEFAKIAQNRKWPIISLRN